MAPASRLPRLKDPRSARAFPLDAARCRHGGFPPRDGGRPGGLREGPPGGRLQHLRQVRRATRSPHPPRARPPALPRDGDAPTGLERATESPRASRGASPRVASSGRRALTPLLDVVFPERKPSAPRSYIRRQETQSRVIGTLLGSVHPDGSVDVRNSYACLLYTSPSPRDRTRSRMPSSA